MKMEIAECTETESNMKDLVSEYQQHQRTTKEKDCRVLHYHSPEHDSVPTTDEHDAYNSNSPQPQPQQEEKGSSEVGQESSKVPKETESGSKKSTAGAKDKAKKKAAVAQKKKTTFHSDPKEC